MKIKKILSTLFLSTIFLTPMVHNASAAELSVPEDLNIKYEFVNTDETTVNKMIYNLHKSKKQNRDISLNSLPPLSSVVAKSLDVVGFNHSAYLLNYSMLPMRVEPLEIEGNQPLPNDIWQYSPEFKSAVTQFLLSARSANATEYFRTTTLNFEASPQSAPEVLANTALRKRTDIFGALHSVRLNLGVVKSGLNWHVLVLIEDRYDFVKQDWNGFTSIVNNIANNDQELGNIKPYDIFIYGDRYDLTRLPFGVPIW